MPVYVYTLWQWAEILSSAAEALLQFLSELTLEGES